MCIFNETARHIFANIMRWSTCVIDYYVTYVSIIDINSQFYVFVGLES